jgi:uncharacterized protein GlcG (DUF336 family)
MKKNISAIRPMTLALATTCFVLTAISPSSSAADKALSTKTVSFDFALELASSAMKACAAKGAKVGVVVVDAAGGVMVALRADTARPHVTEFAQRKAYTSAMLRYPTDTLVENWWAQRGGPGLLNPPGMIALRGGAPIFVDGEVIGGIGVAGGRGGPEDSACINEAFAKAGIVPPPAAIAGPTTPPATGAAQPKK